MLNNLSSIKEELQGQQRKIKKELEQIAKKSGRNGNRYEPKFPEYGRAEDENADEVAAFVDAVSMGENLKGSLEKVELALQKITRNQYGLCEICGKKIGKKRIKILPTARYCLSCKINKN
ncbi:TraR/DksA C4-type zinc finger protein [Patescibacteria group bacterium]|nr:TraR/DksA C4-type zinc finger protein [Patescibacteria group bacterium]